MTDHKYPNELSSCHSMLKKRDGIIEQFRKADNQPSESILELEEEITRLEDEHSKTIVAHKKCEQENDSLSEEIIKLQKQLDQECDSNAELEDKVTMLLPNEQEEKYKEKIKVLEEKLSLCDKYYKEQQDKVHKVGRHVQELVILLDID